MIYDRRNKYKFENEMFYGLFFFIFWFFGFLIFWFFDLKEIIQFQNVIKTPTKEDCADMLAEFEEYAESKRYMHCLELAQFAEWREWDRVMEQANPIKRWHDT